MAGYLWGTSIPTVCTNIPSFAQNACAGAVNAASQVGSMISGPAAAAVSGVGEAFNFAMESPLHPATVGAALLTSGIGLLSKKAEGVSNFFQKTLGVVVVGAAVQHIYNNGPHVYTGVVLAGAAAIAVGKSYIESKKVKALQSSKQQETAAQIQAIRSAAQTQVAKTEAEADIALQEVVRESNEQVAEISKALKEQISNLNLDVLGKDLELQEINEEFETIKKKLENAKQEISDLNEAATKAEQAFNEAQAEIEELNARVKAAEETIEQYRQAGELAVEKFVKQDQKILKLKNRVSELTQGPVPFNITNKNSALALAVLGSKQEAPTLDPERKEALQGMAQTDFINYTYYSTLGNDPVERSTIFDHNDQEQEDSTIADNEGLRDPSIFKETQESEASSGVVQQPVAMNQRNAFLDLFARALQV